MLGVCMAGPRRVLSRSRRDLGGFLAVLWRFSAYSQRVLLGSRLSWHWTQFLSTWSARGSQHDGKGMPGAAKMNPGAKKVATGSPGGFQKRSKTGVIFAKGVWTRNEQFPNNLGGVFCSILAWFWEPKSLKNRIKNPKDFRYDF